MQWEAATPVGVPVCVRHSDYPRHPSYFFLKKADSLPCLAAEDGAGGLAGVSALACAAGLAGAALAFFGLARGDAGVSGAGRLLPLVAAPAGAAGL